MVIGQQIRKNDVKNEELDIKDFNFTSNPLDISNSYVHKDLEYNIFDSKVAKNKHIFNFAIKNKEIYLVPI